MSLLILLANRETSGTRTVTFTADAVLTGTGKPTWVSPSNGASMSGFPVLVFVIPVSTGNMHFQIQLDKVSTFDGADFRSYRSDDNAANIWEYWNGSAWTTVPATGVPNTFAGNQARLTVPTELSSGTWHRRVRAGTL